MTVTLHLAPEIEAGLIAQAEASGMAVEEYLLSVVESAVLKSSQKEQSGEERAAAFEAWSAGHRHTGPLSDHAGCPTHSRVSNEWDRETRGTGLISEQWPDTFIQLSDIPRE
jgi:hypothetical protein